MSNHAAVVAVYSRSRKGRVHIPSDFSAGFSTSAVNGDGEERTEASPQSFDSVPRQQLSRVQAAASVASLLDQDQG